MFLVRVVEQALRNGKQGDREVSCFAAMDEF